ncbi:MAG: extracellular catalytic domain type 1 short-chain-length polyhydroxyalkanoate depolymerase [Burkholderiales bacterium]
MTWIKRWTSNARAWLRRLCFPASRGARGKEGRFEAPQRQLVSRLLLTFRAYRLYLPAAATRGNRLPLLVMLHGCKQDAQVFAEGTRMNELADQRDFIVLYPEQSRTANPLGCWNWFLPTVLKGAGEAAAIVRIVRKVAKTYPVDTTRVYVAGMSAGGAMASVLANRFAALFAACAVHSGLKYGAAASPTAALAAMRDGAPGSAGELPKRAAFVPTLVIHGDRDRTVDPVNAGQIIEQARLAAANAAPAQALVESTRRIASARHPYQRRDYVRGGKVVLRLIAVEGLDHAWSGGDDRHPFNDPQGPDASRLIWDFVKDFRRLPDGSHQWSRSWSWSALWNWLRRR